ncbi:hypothetical protein BC940DRAFT_271266 [Gongronella butleri]|nr:hypothetical protein BC940DRAFT_271266 [Gongronella butleri]
MMMDDFDRTFSLDTSRASVLLAIPLASAAVTAFVSGPIADQIGRRLFFVVGGCIHTVGVLIQVVGKSFSTLIVGRLVIGCSLGIFTFLVPLYQCELAQPEHRGRLITFYQLAVTIGFCLAFWIAYGTFNMGGHWPWQLPLMLQMGPSLVLLVGIPFAVPETPRFLIYTKRRDKADKILAKLRMRAKGNDNNRKRLFLGMGLHMMTQFTGINALLFHLPRIMVTMGLAKTNSVLLGNGVGGLVNMLATIMVFFYIDRWGRRRILIVGALAMCVCMILISVVMGVFSKEIPAVYEAEEHVFVYMTNNKASMAVFALLCLFLACFAMSWGAMGWILPAEIYPQHIRARAMGITTASMFAFSLLVTQVTPFLFQAIGWRTYVIFAGLVALNAVIVHLIYPETRGKTLEEIQLQFSGALVDQSPQAHHPATAAEAWDKVAELCRPHKMSNSSPATMTHANESLGSGGTNQATGIMQKNYDKAVQQKFEASLQERNGKQQHHLFTYGLKEHV